MRRSTWVVLACAIVLTWAQCASSEGERVNVPKADMGAAGIDLADASRHYIMKCAMCHGDNGEPVLVTAPDLRTSTMTVEERVAIIAYGKGTMPPHRDMLDMPTIRGIAVHIGTFRN